MKQVAILGAAMLALAATGAQAQTVNSWDFQPELPSWATVVDFDSPLPNGFSLYGGKIVQGSAANQYAAPAGDATKYLTVGAGQGAAVMADKGYSSVGFYWGSIDKYNTVSLYDAMNKLIATFTGADLPPSDGNQNSAATNRYVSYTLDPGSAIAGIKTLVFSSASNAFEIDNIAFGNGPGSPSPVPEPATLGLFAIGLGALGRRALKRRAG